MVVTDYNEQFLDKRGTDHLIEELKAYINGISTGDIDLSDYVTKAELQAKLDALDINIDLSPYATKEELTQAINSIDLSSYATKSEIPSLDGYAKLTVLPTKVSQLENDSNYLTSVPEEYVTETELNAKGYLTEHQDLSSYATKSEIPSLDGYATTEYVDNAIANVPSGGGTTDLSNYYTKDEVYSKSETDALIPTVTDGVDGADGITPHIDETTKHWMIGDTDTGVMAEGVNGTDGIDGTNGTDGVSPTVTVTKEGKVATITCTDVNGTTTATISDGADGSSSGSGGSSGGSTDVYSTEEIAIGTWIDGSTIYRKVIDVTIKSNITSGTPDVTITPHGIENFDKLINMRCVVNGNSLKYSFNGYTYQINLYNMSSYNNIKNYAIRAYFNGDSIYVDAGSGWKNKVITVIIEYTKTA